MSTIPESLQQAWALHCAGQLGEAETVYLRILETEPAHPRALHLLGLLTFQMGRGDDAVKYLERAVAADPSPAACYTGLGEVHRRLGHLGPARNCFERAVQLEGRLVGAWYQLGSVCFQQQDWSSAERALRETLRLQPELAEAHYNLGNVLRITGRPQEAADSYRRALRFAPDSAGAHQQLGALLREGGDYAAARDKLVRAIELDPTNASSHYDLGATLLRLSEHDAARRHLLEALRLRPNYPHPHCSLGSMCLERGDFDEALAHFERALAIDPDFAEAHTNIGFLLGQKEQYAAALERLDRALKTQPDLALARNNRGMLRLQLGDFAGGWRDYEARLQLPTERKRPSGPAWKGEPIEGRTILLYTEQGLGDNLQFIRYAPRVKARGARVVVGCPQRLKRFFSTCRGIDELYGEEDQPIRCHVHASLVSLPAIFQTNFESIPADVPYLSAPDDLVEHWRRTLAHDGRLRVGIAWQGNPKYLGDARRSMPLAAFAPLAEVEGARLLSLQKGFGSEQLARAPFEVEDIGSQIDNGEHNLCEAAAVINNLDLVVTCDTAVGHLAGALGAPVWVALTRVPDWRWMLDRDDSPWYPTMRLFRQSPRRQWSEVFEAMAQRLRELVAASRGEPSGNRPVA
jgi:tetratricopeptide (TPR) repeat protein